MKTLLISSLMIFAGAAAFAGCGGCGGGAHAAPEKKKECASECSAPCGEKKAACGEKGSCGDKASCGDKKSKDGCCGSKECGDKASCGGEMKAKGGCCGSKECGDKAESKKSAAAPLMPCCAGKKSKES